MESRQQQHDSLFLGKDGNKGEYGIVTNLDDDDDREMDTRQPSSFKMQTMEMGNGEEGYDMDHEDESWHRTFFTPLLPDDQFSLLGLQLMDGVAAVRLFKFVTMTWIGLIGMFYFVRWMGFENDTKYNIPDMIVYDGQPILMDTVFFFVAGRLYKQRGTDHIAWILTAVLSAFFTSLETVFPFLQASVTLYSMHCLWPWTLWVYAVCLVFICGGVFVLHVREVVRQKQFAMKIFELSLTVLVFLLPPMSSPYFHFHHWYAGWLVGMHCNLDVWWSRLTMAWCWGAYVNGIAVYGRDPLLTCGYSFYLSYSSHCPYLKCYVDAVMNHTSTQTTYKAMEAQDWRNCSATDYMP